jgi:hypothetical protein
VCGQEIIYVGIDTTHTHSHKSIWHGFIIIQPSPAPHKSHSGHFYYELGWSTFCASRQVCLCSSFDSPRSLFYCGLVRLKSTLHPLILLFLFLEK